MPTLIRLVIVLLVLAGLVYGAMFALVAFVEPNEKEVTIRIPARDLMPTPDRDPLVLREIDTSRPADSPPAEDAANPAETAGEETPPADTGAPEDASEAEAANAAEPADEEGSIVTLSPGTE